MLTLRRVVQRAAFRPCSSFALASQTRHLTTRRGRPSLPPSNSFQRQNHVGKDPSPRGTDSRHVSRDSNANELSLVEQLFPEESRRYREQQQQAAREVPRLPLEPLQPSEPIREGPHQREQTPKSWRARRLETEMEAAGPGTSVLVLRNASPNLTEEDFRRLIPQGRHIEGWTLQQGDILKVIPGRNLETLAKENFYFLLFSSALSAHTYQGHVTRIHNLAAAHTPSSITSPIPPPPGYMIEGLDVHSAIEAYTLVPPSQSLELRKLQEPFTPIVRQLVKNEGYSRIVNRSDKMPFEARLTLEGAQMKPSQLRHVIMESGKARGLSWSGGEAGNVRITQWVPTPSPSPLDMAAITPGKEAEASNDLRSRESRTTAKQGDVLKRRTPPAVYVIGFHTKQAADSFVQHWHRRPLPMTTEDGDLPPIVNVEFLW